MYRIEVTANNTEELARKVREICDQLNHTKTAEPTAEPEPARRKWKVLMSPYPDINPGDIGEMMGMVGQCVALRFDKLFTDASNPETRTKKRRTIAFEPKCIEEVK